MLRVHTIRYDESRRRCGPVRARGAGTRRVPEPARFGAVYAPAVRGRESAPKLRSVTVVESEKDQSLTSLSCIRTTGMMQVNLPRELAKGRAV